MLNALIRQSHVEVSGSTYHHREMLKRMGFQWNANLKIWYHTDVTIGNTLRRPFIVKRLDKQYITKDASDKRKMEILRVCKNLPSEISENIFKMVNPPKCRCFGDSQCINCMYACCEYATPAWCVCSHATNCPKHGRRCNGSHD
jgi:hypothetical protein